MKNTAVILKTRSSLIELNHLNSDPGAWIVRRWKKYLWFRKRISSDWFNNKEQALVFARELQEKKDL